MGTFETLSEAREILEIPESATMEMIKSNYRRLLAAWHPDTCTGDPEVCAEMTRKIVDAYQLITKYCANYHYSFSEDTVKGNLSPEDWWFERFDNDPLWGSGRGKK